MQVTGRPSTSTPQKRTQATPRLQWQLTMPEAPATARPRSSFAGVSLQQTAGPLGLRPQRTAGRRHCGTTLVARRSHLMYNANQSKEVIMHENVPASVRVPAAVITGLG